MSYAKDAYTETKVFALLYLLFTLSYVYFLLGGHGKTHYLRDSYFTGTLLITETIKKVFAAEMADLVIRHTNKEANTVYEQHNEKNPQRKRLT